MDRRQILAFAAVALLIGLTAGFLHNLRERQRLGQPGLILVDKAMLDEEGNKIGDKSVEFPDKVFDFISTNRPIEQEVLGFLPKDTTYGRRRYSRPEFPDGDIRKHFDMTVVLMGSDRTSIHKPQFCLTGGGWAIDSQEIVMVPIERPHRYDLPVMKMTASRQVEASNGRKVTIRAVYGYWFVAKDRITAEHSVRMWSMVEDLFTKGVLPRWAYVSCFAMCFPGEEQATFDRMASLISATVPDFQITTLPGSGRISANDSAVTGGFAGLKPKGHPQLTSNGANAEVMLSVSTPAVEP